MASPRNVVVCCDGTSNTFGTKLSNVAKLFSILERGDDTSQVSFYDPGVGTMGSPSAITRLGKKWTRLLGLAFGVGLEENVAEAYRFLMNEVQPGDRVFIFGF